MQTGLEGKPWYVGAAVGLVLALVIAGASYKMKLEGMKTDIVRKDARLAELQKDIQKGEAAEQQLPQLREKVARLENDLEKLLKILPNKRNVSELIRQLRALAEREDFDLVRFDPGQEVEREFFNEWPITVRIDGTYHALARFFDTLSRFSRIINVDNLRVTSSRTDPTKTLSAGFTAKTFVYKELEEDAPGSGVGGNS
jgi:type IV pilus assembly protein PilO